MERADCFRRRVWENTRSLQALTDRPLIATKGLAHMRPLYLPDTVMGDDDAMVEEFYRYVYHRDGNGWIFGPVVSTGPDSDVYAALYYSGEVRNGGHQQFILNSDDRRDILEAALSGLAEIGANPQHAVLSEMKAWTAANPHHVDMIMRHEMPSHYRTGRPTALDALDERFFAEQDAHSVEARTAAWIRAYPGLQVIPEAEFMALLNDGTLPAEARFDTPGKIRLWDKLRAGIFGR